jgi:hypothetical protein
MAPKIAVRERQGGQRAIADFRTPSVNAQTTMTDRPPTMQTLVARFGSQSECLAGRQNGRACGKLRVSLLYMTRPGCPDLNELTKGLT